MYEPSQKFIFKYSVITEKDRLCERLKLENTSSHMFFFVKLIM